MGKKKPARRVPFETPQPRALQTSAAQRAFDSMTRTIGKETTKANKADLERRKAMAAALPCLIETLDEPALTALFFGLEDNATASDRKKIATHPLRPDAVDGLHAEVAAEREAERLAEEAQAEEAAAREAEEPRKAEEEEAREAEDTPEAEPNGRKAAE